MLSKMMKSADVSARRFVGDLLQRIPVALHLRRPGAGPEDSRHEYQRAHNRFSIQRGWKVLDIGSGHDPFPEATHLADFYEGDTSHRAAALKRDSRPFTHCSVEKTPFLDKEFDFVYCSHVLEHTDDPARACEELMRIGKRGYIETPAKISDIMFNFTRLENHHRWNTQLLGGTLVFLEWPDNERRDLGTNFFFDAFHSRWDNPFQRLYQEQRDLFVCMLMWEDKFDYIVVGKDGRIRAASAGARLPK